MSAAEPEPTRTRDEIEATISGFSLADWARLRKAARIYSSATMEAGDLLQEAVTRALCTRECPADVDVIRFLAQAMRSIAHAEKAKMKHVAELVAVAQTGDADEGVNLQDEGEGPETVLISMQAAANYRSTFNAIRSLFADDPVARDVLDGRLEELTPQEIQELTGISKTGYESKMKLIRRRIEKAYPKGWKP